MKNIYDISKAQLITLWVFGVIGWFWAQDKAGSFGSSVSEEIAEFLVWLLPFAVIFYTIGWWNKKKNG